MPQQDIFSEATNWWNNRGQRTQAAVTQKEINLANRYRSDRTIADEMRIVFYCILVAATAVTVFLGYNYYLTVFNPISPDYGWLVAAILSLITEIGKCTLLLYVCYAIFFGWFRQSWGKFFYYLTGFALSVGTYLWSVHISTRGAEEYAIEQAGRTVPRDSLSQVIALGCADLDRQIADQSRARDAANAIKWKGTTTVQAQRNAGAASRILENLQTQRAERAKQLTDEYRQGLLSRSEKINHLATFVRRSGGWLELASFLCIVALALATVNLVQTRREETAKTPNADFQ